MNGSDLDEFPDDGHEPGEVSSSESEVEQMTPSKKVTSKVTKVVSHKDIDRFEKFSHLSQDPDFKDFVKEIVDDRCAAREADLNKSTKSHHHKKGIADTQKSFDTP